MNRATRQWSRCLYAKNHPNPCPQASLNHLPIRVIMPLHRLLVFNLITLCDPLIQSHPIPDITVQWHFQNVGETTIYIEIDPRSFDKDPLNAHSVTKTLFPAHPEQERTEWLTKAD